MLSFDGDQVRSGYQVSLNKKWVNTMILLKLKHVFVMEAVNSNNTCHLLNLAVISQILLFFASIKLNAPQVFSLAF